MSMCLFVWCCADNRFGPEGAKHLAPALTTMTNMTTLNLYGESRHFVLHGVILCRMICEFVVVMWGVGVMDEWCDGMFCFVLFCCY